MFGFLRNKPNEREKKILARISASRDKGFKSMRVDRDGTMVVDIKEAISSDSFKSKAKAAREIVSNA